MVIGALGTLATAVLLVELGLVTDTGIVIIHPQVMVAITVMVTAMNLGHAKEIHVHKVFCTIILHEISDTLIFFCCACLHSNIISQYFILL